MTTKDVDQPKGFTLFVGLSFVLGVIGLAANVALLSVSVTHISSPDTSGGAPFFLLALLHIARDAGFIVGAVKVRKRVEWARILLIACATISLCELLVNTARLWSKGVGSSPSSIGYFLIPFLLEGGIIYYFSRKSVRDFVAGPAQG